MIISFHITSGLKNILVEINKLILLNHNQLPLFMTMKAHIMSHLFQHKTKKFTPKQISDTLEMKNGSIRRTCLELDALGFISKSDKSQYSTTLQQAGDFVAWSKHQKKMKELERKGRKKQ
jgi:hypothetical protein